MTHRRMDKCIKCGASATHRAMGNPNYIVCKKHADVWDAILVEQCPLPVSIAVGLARISECLRRP